MKTTNDWWTSFKVSEKERIASKIKGEDVHYPECTEVWESLTNDRKESIRKHCEGKHGDILADWKEGKPYGD